MVEPEVVRLRDGDHACILLASDEEQQAIVTGFLGEGLRTRQRVLNLADRPPPATMRTVLQEAGHDVATCEASGQLTIRKARDAYLPQGRFDPPAMVAMLQETLRQALAAGWDGMRGSGDMGWACDEAPGSDRIMEYEASLNHVIPGSRFRALCQYDVRRFPAETLLEVLTTHPIAFVGFEQLENFYYMPPEEYLGEARPAAQLQRWTANLRARQVDDARRQTEFARQMRLERAQQELAARNAFINTAAHELATPLTPIGLQLHVLANADPATPVGQYATGIAATRRSYARLRDVIAQLLSAARAASGALQLEKARHDVAGIVRATAAAAAPAAAARGLELAVECPEPAEAEADLARVTEVVTNLLSNAIKFTPPGGRIRVQCRSVDGDVEVSVHDTGEGLDPQRAEALFAPFSGGTTEHFAGGLGLGLHVSRRIVEAHGGRIEAESPGRGRGATFRFWIPRAEGPPTTPVAPRGSKRPAPARGARRPPGTAEAPRAHLDV